MKTFLLPGIAVLALAGVGVGMSSQKGDCAACPKQAMAQTAVAAYGTDGKECGPCDKSAKPAATSQIAATTMNDAKSCASKKDCGDCGDKTKEKPATAATMTTASVR